MAQIILLSRAGALNRVCDTLKGLGRHKDAALVYEECADEYCQFEVHETETSKLYLITSAGNAFACSRSLDRAEEAYIKALNIASLNGMDLFNRNTQQIMQHLLTVYSKWPEGGEMWQYTAVNEALQIICGTLLAIAGIRLQPTLINLIKPAMIHDKYKERKEA
jgi:hypothetical protein